MIIKRGVKIQLMIFAIITAVTMAYTLVNIIGIGQGVLDLRYKVYLDLADSGGIFTNAEVTYRGVTVGRVGPLKLTNDGVRVELRIDRGRKVPANGVQAYILNRSGVGEQYVDLRPAGMGPSLKDNSVIQRDHTHLPVQTYELLHNVDALVRTVNPKDLGTVIDELDKGLSGTGPDLQSLLDSNKRILDSLDQTYPETIQLLNNGRTVLDTQVDEAPTFREFSHNLASLTDELKKGDGDVRSLLNTTPGALDQGNDLFDRLEPTLPTLLANGAVTGQVLTLAHAPAAADADHVPAPRRRRLHGRAGRRHRALRPGAQLQRPARVHQGVREHPRALPAGHPARVGEPQGLLQDRQELPERRTRLAQRAPGPAVPAAAAGRDVGRRLPVRAQLLEPASPTRPAADRRRPSGKSGKNGGDAARQTSTGQAPATGQSPHVRAADPLRHRLRSPDPRLRGARR